ncbi:MAG TPA: hypothetical protein VGB82_29180 [Alphaproteobacteria bacterium]
MASPRQDARTEQADEVVGLFRSADAVEAAISALTSAGWDRSELSLLAQKSAFDANPPMGDAERAADDPNTQRAPVVSGTDVRQGRTLATSLAGVIAAFIASGATILTGGSALAAIIGAAAAGGGAAAAVEALGQWAGHSRDDFLHEQVKRGGILLFVMLRRPDQEQIARDILVKHGAEEVRVHHARQAEPATGH